MSTVLWIVQILLAAHTAIGAIWKFSHSPAQTMPSLSAIPRSAWLGMSVAELIAAACLVLPFLASGMDRAVPYAAAFVAAEMLLFVVLHKASGSAGHGPVAYWLVVAAIAAIIAWMRWA